MLLMSSFSVFDSKGENLEDQRQALIYRTKYGLHVVMVREMEDSGLWIAYVMGEFVARLKSIMTHGDKFARAR